MKVAFLSVYLFFATVAYSGIIPISATINQVKASDKRYAPIKPGDTLVLDTGSRGAIQFVNITGTPDKPITIMNADGLCEITTTTHAYGISLRNCHYIKLCGKGSKNFPYGIKVAKVDHDGAGLGISDRTDNLEVSNLEISFTKGPGILCKTNPDCFTYRENSTQYNFSIHNNFVHDTGTEGMYIGSTAFEGVKLTCDSALKVLLPPLLTNVAVFNNLVQYTGWDGIQVSNATNVFCYKNEIYHDSQKQQEWQNCGLIIGGGASGKFYENTIAHGKGYGVNCFGNDTVEIAGNIITMDSAENKPAIYVSDKLANINTHYLVNSNTITSNSLPVIKMVNKKRKAPDEVLNNKLIPYDSAKSIIYEGLKPLTN